MAIPISIPSTASSTQGSRAESVPDRRSAIAWLPVVCIAGGIVLLHILTNGRYGFHRDELQFLSDARHMDWGFVAYPPMTAFLEHISLAVFGLSLIGLRLFSVIAQATALVVTAMMASELGGGRMAQVAATLAVALSPLPLFEGTEFQYSSFDYLWWVLIAYFTIRLLRSEDPRWWLAIGAIIGLGLLTKYSIVFYIAGILAGVALARARRYLASGWFWGGVALALLIFLPNLLWLVRHDFISYRFLQHIHARDVSMGRTGSFLPEQLWLCANLIALPIWIAGLVSLLRNGRYRMLALMYIVPLVLFTIGKGRSYYLAGAYPMLLAMGSVVGERWIASARQASSTKSSARQRDKKAKRARRRHAARTSDRGDCLSDLHDLVGSMDQPAHHSLSIQGAPEGFCIETQHGSSRRVRLDRSGANSGGHSRLAHAR